MQFSLFSMARLAAGVALVVSAVAVGVARFAPASPGLRMISPPPYTNINAFYLNPCGRGSVWVERDDGSRVAVPSRGDELLEYASCSPWSDERGRRQVVGRWAWAFQGETAASYGLTRLSFPDGEVLDHIETDVVPVSTLCWYPGTGARVLFAGGDGRLYRYSFETQENAGRVTEDAAGQPRPLTWECEIAAGNRVFLSDPFFPAGREFQNLLFVGLRMDGQPRATTTGPTRIWWLRLSDDGASIVEAGPLFEDKDVSPEVLDRCPVLGTTVEGRHVLAFFRKLPSRSSSLVLAEIGIGARHGGPKVLGGEVEALEDCLTSPPVFSSDGHWVSAVQQEGQGRTIRRVRLEEVLNSPLRRNPGPLARAGDGRALGGL